MMPYTVSIGKCSATARVLHEPANSPICGKIEIVAPLGSSDAICSMSDSSCTLKDVSINSACLPSSNR